MSRLPEEIIERILARLKGNLRALRSCALASRIFLTKSHKIIYQNLVVVAGTVSSAHIGPDTLTAQRLCEILKDNSNIGLFVRSLHIYEANSRDRNPERPSNEETVARFLPHLRNLECLSIQFPENYLPGSNQG